MGSEYRDGDGLTTSVNTNEHPKAPIHASTPAQQDSDILKQSYQISPSLQPGLEVWDPTSYPETVTHSTLEHHDAPHSALEPNTPRTIYTYQRPESTLPPSTAVESEYGTYFNSTTMSPSETVLPSEEKRPKSNRADEIAGTSVDESRKRKRKWIIVIAVLVTVIIIIVAVVLGVVLSKKKSGGGSNNGSADASNVKGEDETAPPDPTGSPTAIRLRSGLGAAGWKSQRGYSIRLFFQDNSNYIRMSAYNSWEKEWKGSALITKGNPGTSIAAAHLTIDGFDQTNVYFLGEGSCIQEWAVIPNKPVAKGNISEVCEANPKPHPSSRLATYFPSLFFQGEDGLLGQYAYGQRREHKIYDWGSKLFEETVGLKGKKGTGLAMFATSKTGTSLATFYQAQDKVLSSYEIPKFGLRWEGRDWVNGSIYSEVPAGTAIGGLSYVRTDGSLSQHVLYQEADGDIHQYYNLDGDVWIGPTTSDPLKGALKDTEIACVSIAPDPASNSLLVEPGLARCFYQLETGQIREIRAAGDDLDGEWKVVGTIPLE